MRRIANLKAHAEDVRAIILALQSPPGGNQVDGLPPVIHVSSKSSNAAIPDRSWAKHD